MLRIYGLLYFRKIGPRIRRRCCTIATSEGIDDIVSDCIPLKNVLVESVGRSYLTELEVRAFGVKKDRSKTNKDSSN